MTRQARRSVRVLCMLVSALASLLPSVPSAAAAATDAQPAAVIVVLRDGVAAQSVAAEHAGRHRLAPTYVFQHALRGYAAAVPTDRLAQVRADPRVESFRNRIQVFAHRPRLMSTTKR